MDAFDDMMTITRRRQQRTVLFVSLIIILLFFSACMVFLFINRFTVAVQLQGDREITLEYGQSYEDPGASAVFFGKYLAAEARPLEVVTKGSVDEQIVGSHTIEYTASFGIWKGNAVRTVHIVDSVAPRIMLKSSKASYTVPGQAYAEEGFAARDNYDGDITGRVKRSEKGGIVTYYVEDSSGNKAEVTRDIVYYDPVAPELNLLGEDLIIIGAGDPFEDPGFSAVDNSAGDITERVQVSGSVNIYKAGTYQLQYYVEDVYDNVATAVRTVQVERKPQPKTVIPEGKVIYLTFDDGPSSYTPELLEVLKKYDVKATFFVCNTDYIDTLKDIAADGHAIGIHSVTHTYKEIYASEEAYFADLFAMQGIIEEKTGMKTTLVRFPGGGSNTVSRFNEGIMTRLTQALHDMGFQYFDWNVDSDDAGGSRTTKKVLRNIKEGVEKHEYSIVLQHDVKGYSVRAVEDIILWGLENGYTFLPLDPTSPTCHHGINN